MTPVSQQRADEYDRLTKALGELEGLFLVSASFGAGSELFIWFGKRPGWRPHTHREPPSDWLLATLASKWVLLGDVEVLATERDGDEQATLAAFRDRAPARVTSAAARQSDFMLQIAFENGTRIVLFTNKPRWEPRPRIALWELVLAEHRGITVQRNGDVDFYPSNVPIGDLIAQGLVRE